MYIKTNNLHRKTNNNYANIKFYLIKSIEMSSPWLSKSPLAPFCDHFLSQTPLGSPSRPWPPRCLSDTSQRPPRITVWGLALGSYIYILPKTDLSLGVLVVLIVGRWSELAAGRRVGRQIC